jgi:Tol biopolymer transport system component
MAYPITGGTEPFEFAPGVSSLSIGWGPHGQGGLGNVYAALRPPRGDRVLVANDAASDSGHSLMVVDGDGSNATTPLRLMFYSLSSPAWSPDGSRILFAASVDVPGPCAECWRDQRVYVISADGSRLRRLSNATRADPPNVIVVESAPSWSPDGRRIGLMRRVGPAGDRGMPQEPGALVVVDVETGVERGAYGAGLGFDDWTWSPDGRSVLVDQRHLADFSNRMVLVTVESGDTSVIPWDHLSAPTWQRLAR